MADFKKGDLVQHVTGGPATYTVLVPEPDRQGVILIQSDQGGLYHLRLAAVLQPMPKRHTFGGVVYEETGECRSANCEWVLDPNRRSAQWWPFVSSSPHTILRLVGLEGKHD